MEKVIVEKINDHIYAMQDEGACGYIVVGSKKVAVIDTMFGSDNLKDIVRSITNLPIIVINTHGHGDHVDGNLHFEEAYIHPSDLPMAEGCLEEVRRNIRSHKVEAPMEYATKKFTWKSILPGDQVDLGDLTLEVFNGEGHTKGSIVLLDRKDRILFTGDAINGHLWMQLDHSLALSTLLQTLNHLDAIRDAYDHILHGHYAALMDASIVEELKSALADMIAGKNEFDTPYEYYAGVVKAHPYGKEEPYKIVVYDPRKEK